MASPTLVILPESMTEIRIQETQQELFQEFSEKSNRTERLPSVTKTQKPILLSTNIEQIILAGILLILSLCLVFFLGVLRGQSLSRSRTPTAIETRTAGPGAIEAALVRPIIRTPEIKPPSAPAAALPVGQNLNKPYTIQLVTYKKKELAEKDVAEFRRRGVAAMIITSADYYQVCAGQYLNKGEAKKDLKLFSARYRDCFLRRR